MNSHWIKKSFEHFIHYPNTHLNTITRVLLTKKSRCCLIISIISFFNLNLILGLSRVPDHRPEPTNPTGINPSWPDWHLWRVSDESKSSKPDPGRSSGGFRPQKPDLPDPPNKTSKRRPKSDDVWASFTQISSNPHSDKLKFGESSPDLLKLR